VIAFDGQMGHRTHAAPQNIDCFDVFCMNDSGFLQGVRAHPRTAVFGFARSAISVQLSAKTQKNKRLAEC
jgi:hypothetical protein